MELKRGCKRYGGHITQGEVGKQQDNDAATPQPPTATPAITPHRHTHRGGLARAGSEESEKSNDATRSLVDPGPREAMADSSDSVALASGRVSEVRLK